MGLIEIRDVPDDVHRILAARAAAANTTVGGYVLRAMTHEARIPTPQELDAWIRARPARREDEVRTGEVGSTGAPAAREPGRRS